MFGIHLIYNQEDDMTFVEALYSGKEYLRCPYFCGSRTGYLEVDIKTTVLGEMLGLYDEEFASSKWEVSEDNYDWED
jgi:hypothetical protein